MAWAANRKNLPGFIVLNGGLIPPGGLDNFNSGFLPAAYQGSSSRPAIRPWPTSCRSNRSPICKPASSTCFASSMPALANASATADEIESAIKNYETAFRMQAAVPELMDLKGESDATKKLYGIDAKFPQTRTFAPAMPDRPAAGRTRRALHRTDLPASRRRPLGPAFRLEERPRKQRPCRRSADRRPAHGLESARLARRIRWSSGPANSAARRSRKGRTAAITISSASRSGWPAAA